MKKLKRSLSLILTAVLLLSSLSINITVNADEGAEAGGEEVVATERVEEEDTDTENTADEKITDEAIDTEIAEAPSTVTERGMQFKIEDLSLVKSIRYAYGELETEKDIKYGEGAVSHSGKTLRKRGDSCVLQFLFPGLVSIVITYNDGTRDFYKYEVIKSEPTVIRDGGNSITFENLDDLKVLRYVKGEYENSYDIKRASGSVAISGKTLTSDTYTVALDRETYTFCVQYNDESYNYYATGVCGDNLTWVYDKQSATLTISGEGEMEDYKSNNMAPWIKYIPIIKTVVLKPGITKIGQYAFSYCSSLVKIDIPITLKLIGDEAFYTCNALETIVFPDSLERIGGFAFSECTSLKSIIIPDGVTYIGTGAFIECENLESVILGDNIETINMQTFYKCSNLKTMVFGKNVKTISEYAFYYCASLNDIDLPDSVEKIGMLAFFGTRYYNNKDNWDNNVLYLDNHLIDTKSNLGTYIIKDGTKSIAAWALEDTYVNILYIPESVVDLGEGALTATNCQPTSSRKPIFMVVKGSCAEEYVIKYNYSYNYFNPSEIYK